ncbi:MAG: hypothetical protein IJY39_14355 [Clostridia bacterium]|nr:hypothetical protein [Clostridia bacterium]
MEQYTKHTAGGYLQLPLGEKTVTTELSGDFTLPDYQPEIKRLLRVGAEVLPPSKYIGSREAELEGSIDYYVYYTGSDNEVYCAPLSTEYKVSIPMETTEEQGILNLNVDVTVIPDLVIGRVTSPRKLSIKCRLRTRAEAFGEMALEDGFDSETDGVEVLYGDAEVTRTCWGTGEQLRLSDEMIADSREGELRVISGEGRVLMNEIGVADGHISCRGDLYLRLMMSREDGTAPYTAVRKLPFSQNIPVEGVRADYSASARGSLCDMSITVEDGRVCIDVGLILEARACGNESVCYVKDAYSTERKTDCRYRSVRMPTDGTSFHGNFTLSDSVALEDVGLSAGVSVVDVSGMVTPEECGFERDKCTVTGKAKFSLLTQKDGEYSVSDVELPFRYEVKTQGEAIEACCEAAVVSARARVDGERVGIDAEIGIGGAMRSMAEASILDAVDFGEALTRAKGVYVICYPSAEDSLWSVAKRYGTPQAIIAKENSLPSDLPPDSAESLSNAKYLMI